MSQPTSFSMKFQIKDGRLTDLKWSVVGGAIDREILEVIEEHMSISHMLLAEKLSDILPPPEEIN